MLEPIGYIGYFSQRPVLDIIGLVSPEALASYSPEINEPLHDLVTKFHPEVLVLRLEEVHRMTMKSDKEGQTVVGGEYSLLASFSDRGSQPLFQIFGRRGRQLPR